MSDLNTQSDFYLTTLELMNLETLVSARIQDSKQLARKHPNEAHIHLELTPGYEELGEKLRSEIDFRFDAIRAHNNGALFTVNSDR